MNDFSVVYSAVWEYFTHRTFKTGVNPLKSYCCFINCLCYILNLSCHVNNLHSIFPRSRFRCQETTFLDFPGGPVDKNPPANAGDMGSIPGPGSFHTRWRNGAAQLQSLSSRPAGCLYWSLQAWSPSATRRAATGEASRPQRRAAPTHHNQSEPKQWGSSAATEKSILKSTTSPAVRWLRLYVLNARGIGWIPTGEAKIHAAQHGQKHK